MFSKPVPKLPEPTRSTSRAVKCESPDTGRVKSKRESAECLAFQQCFSVLAEGITDPGRLAVQLYSRELIGPDLRTEAQKQAIGERVKIVTLLSAVEDQIVASPAIKFREFLDVLQNEPSLQHLATRLENSYHELSELHTSSVLPPMSTPSSPPCTTCTQCSPSLPTSEPPPTSTPSSPFTLYWYQLAAWILTMLCYYPYASYLKSVYTQEKLPIYDKWPHMKSRKFINLALIEKEDITKPEADRFTRATIHGNIDDIKKSKQAMNMDQVAQLPDGSQPKCILVEGAPGVGKSTFAWKLCHKWGKGKLLPQYQLVVLLRLRDKSVRAAKNISDLFQYHDHQIQQAVLEEIQRTRGKGVLLLIEGYDELPERLRTKRSIFLDVITGRKLPEATVLITSRPWASEFLHRECKKHISQHIEIVGFTKANIQSYLESTIPNDPSLLTGLKKYISCYPHISGLMYIPLNSAIVVEVYRNSRKDKTLVPKTMTELYSSLVRSLLLRHLLDHPVHGKKRRWRIRNFSDLPQDVYQQLCELGRIAYEGILHEQQVIFSDLPENFETLGLMQCAPELYIDEGVAVSYNFLHLTVQEYLAAFHLSQQPEEKQIEHFRKYKDHERQNTEGFNMNSENYHEHLRHVFHMLLQSTHDHQQSDTHFHMVLQFLSGTRKFRGYPSEVLNTLCVEKYCDYLASAVYDVTFNTLHWLFEAQDNDVTAKVLGSYIYLRKCNDVTSFDCFVLGYCVSHSNCAWQIELGSYDIGDEGVEMLVQGAVEEETNCMGGIFAIELSSNDITSEGVKHLLRFPKKLIEKLEILELHFNPNIGQGGAAPLLTLLTAHNSLRVLWLFDTGIGVEDCQALRELLSSSTSLKDLDISHDNHSPEAVELIISGIHHNTTLERFHMHHSHLSLQNTISLASVLRTNHTLVELNLGQCNIDSDGACQLASALCTNDTLQRLLLCKNPIRVKGAAAFAEMLLKNKSLKLLSFDCHSIGEEGTQKLIDSLTRNTTVETLYLPKKYKSFITSSGVDSSRVSF